MSDLEYAAPRLVGTWQVWLRRRTVADEALLAGLVPLIERMEAAAVVAAPAPWPAELVEGFRLSRKARQVRDIRRRADSGAMVVFARPEG